MSETQEPTKELKFTMVVAESMDGGYVGYVEELPGCATQGETIEELRENMEDLIPAFIEAMVQELHEKQSPPNVGRIIERQTYRVKPLELIPA